MTHYSVTVAIDPNVEPGIPLYQAVTEALAPYDENLPVEPFIEVTRIQADNDEKFLKWWKDADEKARAKGLPPRSYEVAAMTWWGGVWSMRTATSSPPRTPTECGTGGP